MKVLHVVASLDFTIGGPAKSVSDLSLNLAVLGHDITVLTKYSDNPYLKESPHPNLKLQFIGDSNFKKALNNLIGNVKFDVIHGHSLWGMPIHYMSCIARENHIPYVIAPRGTLEPWAWNEKKWKKRIAMLLYQHKDLEKAACIHATAEMEAQNIRQLGFKNPIAVIPNGINIYDSDVSISTQSTKKTILFLSRIHPKKGIEILINAWYKIDKSIKTNWRIKIAGTGDPSYVESLKDIVRFKGLDDEIEFLGPVYNSEKNKEFNNADLFVLPTFSENFGVVVAEALSFGVPVITTIGTPWEELNVTKSGWWIETGVEPLVKTLIQAVQLSDSERKQMGMNGQKLIALNYSIQSVASKVIDMYKWIIDDSSKSSFLYQK